jgi:hypothetical protein
MGVCYAPPEGSSTYLHASAVDPFEELKSTIAAFHGLGGEDLIAGELNARTGLYPDHKSDDANDQSFVMPQAHDLWHTPLNVPARSNQDKKTNKFERRLLQLCHDTGLTILNGHVEGDVEGCFTSHLYREVAPLIASCPRLACFTIVPICKCLPPVLIELIRQYSSQCP